MELFKISQPQFEWIVLNERSRSQAWRDLEGIFEKKVNYQMDEWFILESFFLFHHNLLPDVAQFEIEIVFH